MSNIEACIVAIESVQSCFAPYKKIQEVCFNQHDFQNVYAF